MMPRFLVWTNSNLPAWHEADDAEGAAREWAEKHLSLYTSTVINVLEADEPQEFSFELGPKP